jgi:hypothetical protein
MGVARALVQCTNNSQLHLEHDRTALPALVYLITYQLLDCAKFPSLTHTHTHNPPTCLPLQSSSMTPLQILRAALSALADPAGGLGKGMAMNPLTADALRAQLNPSASSLFALLSHPAMHASTSAHPRPASQQQHSKGGPHHPGHASQLLEAALGGLPPPSAAPALQVMRKHHAGVLVDPTGFCNLAAHMTRSSVALVRKLQ